ncbi:MAG: hypothetical protein GOP50_12450 [Candidatus Heimdallarchaeota archaeon]|nr:hypothetical protein [Candidatus Heimdallarchaeota archaeon]
MHKNVRKSDSLAHATGSFMESLEEMNSLWNTDISEILEISPSVIGLIKKIISSKDKTGVKKKEIMGELTKLGELFNNMERIDALMYDLLIEIDGLDFPLKTTRKLMKLNKEEVETTKLLQTFAQNLSKTMAFVESGNLEEELLTSSLKSYKTAYNDYNSIVKKSRELLKNLHLELDKEQQKARKYGDLV